jgi:hypothetical protein
VHCAIAQTAKRVGGMCELQGNRSMCVRVSLLSLSVGARISHTDHSGGLARPDPRPRMETGGTGGGAPPVHLPQWLHAPHTPVGVSPQTGHTRRTRHRRPRAPRARGAASGLGSLRVVLFSDVHLDQAYSASAPPDCNHCRPCSTGGPNATASRPLGRPGCDAPRSLVRAAFAAAAATLPAPDMLLVLGDLAAHNQPSLAATHSAFSEVTDMLSNAFPSASAPGVACGVTIGNNDVFPDYAVNLTADGYYALQAASVAHLCGLSAAQQSALGPSNGDL